MKDYRIKAPWSFSSLCEKPLDHFWILLRVFDHIAADSGFSQRERLNACDLVWTHALKDACGSVLTADSFQDFRAKVDALHARVKQ